MSSVDNYTYESGWFFMFILIVLRNQMLFYSGNLSSHTETVHVEQHCIA